MAMLPEGSRALQCPLECLGSCDHGPAMRGSVRKIRFHMAAMSSTGGAPSLRALGTHKCGDMGPKARQEQSYPAFAVWLLDLNKSASIMQKINAMG